MAPLNVVLRTDKKADKNGRYQIALRVYYKKNIYHFIGLKISEEHWNYRAQKVRASFDKHAIYNNIINEEYTRIDNGLIKLTSGRGRASVPDIKRMIKGEENNPSHTIGFLQYIKKWTDDHRDSMSVSYIKSINDLYNILKEFNGPSLSFKEIDISYIKRFKRYLIHVRENKSLTVHIRIVQFQAMYNYAIKDGYASQETNPFFKYDIDKGVPGEKTYLNFEEIQKINRLDLVEEPKLFHVRNAFLFSFWCAGIRISDICLLDWVDNIKGWRGGEPIIEYEMKKTKRRDRPGKKRTFPLLPPAIEILKYYEPDIKNLNGNNLVFPFLKEEDLITHESIHHAIGKRTTKNNNNYLDKIADRAGIKKHITNHTSRHSFAACFEEMEMPVEILQELLAHSNRKTTEAYRKKLGVALTRRSKKALNEFFRRFENSQAI